MPAITASCPSYLHVLDVGHIWCVEFQKHPMSFDDICVLDVRYVGLHRISVFESDSLNRVMV